MQRKNHTELPVIDMSYTAEQVFIFASTAACRPRDIVATDPLHKALFEMWIEQCGETLNMRLRETLEKMLPISMEDLRDDVREFLGGKTDTAVDAIIEKHMAGESSGEIRFTLGGKEYAITPVTDAA